MTPPLIVIAAGVLTQLAAFTIPGWRLSGSCARLCGWALIVTGGIVGLYGCAMLLLSGVNQ